MRAQDGAPITSGRRWRMIGRGSDAAGGRVHRCRRARRSLPRPGPSACTRASSRCTCGSASSRAPSPSEVDGDDCDSAGAASPTSEIGTTMADGIVATLSGCGASRTASAGARIASGSSAKDDVIGRGSKRSGWAHTLRSCIRQLRIDSTFPEPRISRVPARDMNSSYRNLAATGAGTGAGARGRGEGHDGGCVSECAVVSVMGARILRGRTAGASKGGT